MRRYKVVTTLVAGFALLVVALWLLRGAVRGPGEPVASQSGGGDRRASRATPVMVVPAARLPEHARPAADMPAPGLPAFSIPLATMPTTPPPPPRTHPPS